MRHRAVGMADPLTDRHERRAVHDALSVRPGSAWTKSCPGGCVSSTRRPTCAGARPWSRSPGPASCSRTCTSVGAVRDRDQRGQTHCGLRAGAAGPARRRTRRDPRLGGAGQARPAPVPRGGPPAGVDPAHCFVVGDSVWDLLAAQRAGALGIGLLSGGYGREELERSGAYRVYADPAEMLTRLEVGAGLPLTVGSDRGGCLAWLDPAKPDFESSLWWSVRMCLVRRRVLL